MKKNIAATINQGILDYEEITSRNHSTGIQAWYYEEYIEPYEDDDNDYEYYNSYIDYVDAHGDVTISTSVGEVLNNILEEEEDMGYYYDDDMMVEAMIDEYHKEEENMNDYYNDFDDIEAEAELEYRHELEEEEEVDMADTMKKLVGVSTDYLYGYKYVPEMDGDRLNDFEAGELEMFKLYRASVVTGAACECARWISTFDIEDHKKFLYIQLLKDGELTLFNEIVDDFDLVYRLCVESVSHYMFASDLINELVDEFIYRAEHILKSEVTGETWQTWNKNYDAVIEIRYIEDIHDANNDFDDISEFIKTIDKNEDWWNAHVTNKATRLD